MLSLNHSDTLTVHYSVSGESDTYKTLQSSSLLLPLRAPAAGTWGGLTLKSLNTPLIALSIAST